MREGQKLLILPHWIYGTSYYSPRYLVVLSLVYELNFKKKLKVDQLATPFNLSLTYLRNIPEFPLKIPFDIGVKHTTFCFLFLSL